MNDVFSKVLVSSARSLGYLTLGWLSLSGFILTQTAIAQSSSAKKQPFAYTPPPPPKPEGAPSGRIRGGASRGGACEDYEDLTALVPVQNDVVRGLTTSSNPTLWFYLPVPVGSDLKAEFVLQDTSDDFVYKTPITFNTDSPGIVPITVEAPDPALKADTRYKWTLALYCDPIRTSASVYVTGLLESVAANTANTSTQALSPFEQAAQAAQEGLWFDSLTALGELRQAEPNNPDFTQAWMELLQQVDLEDLAPAPLL